MSRVRDWVVLFQISGVSICDGLHAAKGVALGINVHFLSSPYVNCKGLHISLYFGLLFEDLQTGAGRRPHHHLVLLVFRNELSASSTALSLSGQNNAE